MLSVADPSVWDALTGGTARTTAAILRVLGAEAVADGDLVLSSVLDVEIIRECTGVYPIVIFVSAVLAFPSSWKARLLGIGAGVPAILVLNQVRLVSLCFIGRSYAELFETMHMLVWQSLMVFLTLLIWVVWAALVVRGDEARAA